MHILHYVHLNPLDFVAGAKNWREGHISGTTRALEYLEKYRWSSYRDYCGVRNFPSILTTDLFGDMFGNYKSTIAEYIRALGTDPIRELTLE